MARISLKNVVKQYDNNPVIKSVSLEINDGDFVVFVGPSGCGKSTLLRMIAGLESISAGEIHIDETCVNDVLSRDRGVAMVFQSYALYPHMTVAENMSFALKNLGVTQKEIDQKVNAAAEVLQITTLLNRKPKDMSGGQRQRVAIGRAIVREPKVFLFDEPLSNLDAALRIQMRTELARLHNQLGTTMIYVTHDQIEAMTMASKIVVLRAGQIEQVGSPLELYNYPKNKFVAGFLGSPKMNFMNGTIVSIKETSHEISKLQEDRGLNLTKLTIQTDSGFILDTYSNSNEIEIGMSVSIGVRPEHYYCHDEVDKSKYLSNKPLRIKKTDNINTKEKGILKFNGENKLNDIQLISITSPNSDILSISNSILCSVDIIEQLGNTSYLYLTLPSGESCTVENKNKKSYEFGDKIFISVDTSQVHIFNSSDISI